MSEPCTAAPAHLWRLDTPSGQTVTGTCRHCRLTREYKSYYDEEGGGFKNKPARKAGGGPRPVLSGKAW